LTGYNFNTRPQIFIIFGTSSADIQKSATGITFSTTSLLLTANDLLINFGLFKAVYS